MSSESVDYNEIIFLRLNSLSCEIFANTLDYEPAQDFIKKHSGRLEANERLAFLNGNLDSVNGFEAISKALSSASLEHSYLSYCFIRPDGEYYSIIKYSQPKSQKTTNKLY